MPQKLTMERCGKMKSTLDDRDGWDQWGAVLQFQPTFRAGKEEAAGGLIPLEWKVTSPQGLTWRGCRYSGHTRCVPLVYPVLLWKCGEPCRASLCRPDAEPLQFHLQLPSRARRAAEKPPVLPSTSSSAMHGLRAAWPSLPGALRPVPGLWLRVFTPVFVRGGREGRGRCWGNWNSTGHRAGWVRWPGRARVLQGKPWMGHVHNGWLRVS